MAKISAEAKVGLLVIVGSLLLLYMTIAVGKYQFGEKKGFVLTAAFDSVAGLDIKASVRMAGVKIGSVEEVDILNNRARVTMRINQDIRIPRGSEAVIKTLGLLGEKYVEFIPPRAGKLRGAGPAATYYEQGEEVQATVSPSDVDRLINQLSEISGDIKLVTGSLSRVLGTRSGEQSMEDLLQDLRRTMSNIKDFSYTLQGDGSELVVRLNELTENLNGLVGENRDNLKVTMENVREASRSAELALASLEQTAHKIEQGQGTIGKLVNNDSMYNNIDSAAKGINDYVSRVERTKTVVGFRSEYMFPHAQSYATLELKPRPDQYYILELTSDPFGKYTRTETAATPPGQSVVTETYEDKYAFTAEFVKRWGGIALRLGLIESSGGIGADYFALEDRFKISVDSWNFNSREPGNENAHVKAAASWSLGRTLFVNAGYDNALNRKRASPFVGIGLRFDDDDLKYLMGSVPVPK
jgi:phospholipid/cholesterol/gamma-HCH transport system substrate-binding protein